MEDAVTMDRLPALFETADVGLIPNRASAATHLMLPVKLLEYATVGVPTISARLRTIEHYFGNEDLRYFAPDDSVSLCEAIGDLYLRPDVRARLARNARIAVERLNWQNQRQHYYQAVDSLLSKEKAKQ
jgi:glycosyltransferase involved in cell wall biosynthesis